MNKFFIVGFSMLMIFDTLSQICFKLTANEALPLEMNLEWLGRVFGHIWIYGALLGYAGAFFTWMKVLNRLSIGSSYAASHIDVVSVMILSIWIFEEPLTIPKAVGALIILSGIICLAIAEEKDSNPTSTNSNTTNPDSHTTNLNAH